jgi:hypothetical protein
LDITITSFENFTSDTPDQLQQQKQERSSTMQYIYSSGAIAILLYIMALVIAFVIKEKTKIVGIVLLFIAVSTLILIGFLE